MIINLQKEYKKIMIGKIKQTNLKFPENIREDRLIIHYLSYLRKKSFAGPHRIVKSAEFCCPNGYEKGLHKLETIIEHGGDITPYFNRSASDFSKYDDLFSDWGILHFHLGDELIEGENLVKRGDPVLFAYLHDESVFFIDIYKHGHWTDFGVIQNMYNNWPELIEPYVVPGATSLNVEVSPSDLKKSRESGSLMFISIKGTDGKDICLMPPGMGLNTARLSIQDTLIYDDALNKLHHIQLYLISIEDEIKQDMENQGVILKKEISFELYDFNEQELILFDSIHQYRLHIGI